MVRIDTLVILWSLFIGTKDFDCRKALNAVRCTNGLVFCHVDSANIDDTLQTSVKTINMKSFTYLLQQLGTQ